MKVYEKKFLYIDSVQIVRSSMLWGLLELELNVERSEKRVDIFSESQAEVDRLCNELKEYDIAITQDFIPDVARACNTLKKTYISWIYDCPQMALFKECAFYDTNYIFMFDKSGTEYLKKKGLTHVYYLPLAANILQAASVNITDEDIAHFGSDVSFVGSLYSKDYMKDALKKLSPEAYKDLDSYVSARLCRFNGIDQPFELLTDRLKKELYGLMSNDGLEDSHVDTDYLAWILFCVPILANLERTILINKAAEKYNTRLYTNEKDTSKIIADIHSPVDPESDMYKVFYSSRINLNITWRGIASGLPQRILDIGAVGGFIFTNYQKEIDDFFTVGKDIEVFHDMAEYEYKMAYYLSHERERLMVALGGYKKVQEIFNYRNIISKMLKIVDGDLTI